MASEEGGGDDSGGSLFEGMVLFSLSDLSPPDLPPSPLPPFTSSPLPSQSQPLDEDLFSDLTLQSQTQTQIQLPHSDPPPTTAPPSRQISRKKKRAVRIGYARDPGALEDPPPPPSIETTAVGTQLESDRQLPDRSGEEVENGNSYAILEEDKHHRIEEVTSGGDLPQFLKKTLASAKTTAVGTTPSSAEDPTHPNPLTTKSDRELPDRSREETETGSLRTIPEEDKDHQIGRVISWKEDALSSIEDKLELIRARVSGKLDRLRETAALVSGERKELGRRRRKAMENVNFASVRFRELEKELEEACEAEDFERAERVSESLAAAEKEKDGLLSELRDAELECDSVDLKMQEVLELQIAAEGEGVALLEQFAKDAADYADLVLKDAEEISSKELEEWQSSMELLEVNKIEMDIESQLISEARSGLEDSIEHLVADDRKEVEILKRKQGILAKELDELLALVRLKEAEIAENDSQILEVEKKISGVISEFHETQSSIDMKHDNLQWALSKIESEGEALSIKKKKIDEFIFLAQQKRSKLRELASVSLDEARTCQELVGLRKSLASSILKCRENKVKLAKTEETILVEIQLLRQQISAARTTLQELSSTRASIQQEIAAFKQRIGFIDKRGPELEAEKKVAAAARNFKEAGRIAAEAKALNVEKESLQNRREKAVLDLEKLEEEIKDTADKIQESEGLILLKEKEAAMAGCKRLRLVAAAARAERSAALEMGDVKEGDILLKEAEAAESKARELQETYDLELEEHGKSLEHFVSIALITNLAGQHLAEMDASFNLPSARGSTL